MKCEKCKHEMDAVGMTFGNGWKCPVCGHEEYDLYSWGKDRDMARCSCRCCSLERSMKSRPPKNAKVEVGQVRLRKQAEAKANRETLDGLRKVTNQQE